MISVAQLVALLEVGARKIFGAIATEKDELLAEIARLVAEAKEADEGIDPEELEAFGERLQSTLSSIGDAIAALAPTLPTPQVATPPAETLELPPTEPVELPQVNLPIAMVEAPGVNIEGAIALSME